MPLKSEHLTKAQANEKFADSLDASVYPNADWALTALFYSAVHYVEAYFATKSIHSVDLRARDSAIRRDVKLEGI